MYQCKKEKDDDDKSTKNNTRRAITKKLAKDVKKMTRSFTTSNTQLQKLKEDDSELSNSEEEDEASHFKIVDRNVVNSGFQSS